MKTNPQARLPRDWNRISSWIAAALFLICAGIVFLLPADYLVGSARADIGQQFLAWRAFAADSLRAGHLPLWNPFSYSGEPFLGGFQSAVFYPLNAIFLFLPLCRAVNLSLLAHLFILGWGMRRWAAGRGLHPVAAGLCGLVMPLSGPVFPHVFAGHLPNLCTLAWAPWIFAGLEDWQRGGGRRSLLWASAAVAMQILAGQVQYVFYTAVAAGIHAVACSIAEPAARRRALPAAVCIYAAAAALAAIQLVPGRAAASEGLRQARLDVGFAGQFSLPPESVLTAIAPGFFGDPITHPYWGRCYPWEMSLFVGVSGVLLAAVALSDPERKRTARLDLCIAFLLLLLALGRHTPLFRVLYDAVPGFDRFRGWSKFSFPAVLFIVMALGAGADVLLRLRPAGRAVPLAAIALGLLAGGAGLALLGNPARIAPVLAFVRDTGESYLPAASFGDAEAVHGAGVQAGRELATAGVVSFLAGGFLLLGRRRKALGWAVLCLVPVEMFGFAATQWAHFTPSDAVSPELRAFVAAHPGDYRVQNLVEPNNGFLIGAPDMWGNDPGLLKRYAEFIAFTQGADPDRADQNIAFRSLQPLYGMLRLRYIFSRNDSGFKTFEAPGAMDRVQLVSGYRVLEGRDRLFSAMSLPDFDPRRTVLLETEPVPRPAPDAHAGSVRVIASSADRLTIEADVAAPSILLVTDPYSRDWRASPLPGSSQERYQVLPADYILRATPLAAGHHRIEFEYAPAGLRAGVAISALAWAAWIVLLLQGRRPAARSQEMTSIPIVRPT